MKQRQLGPNGPLVGAIGLGGMPMSISKTRPAEADSVKLIVRAATELGVTLWDTADAYALDDTEVGHNERLFAKAKAELPSDIREKVILATKAGHIRPGGSWITDGRPEYLRSALEASLKALNADVIDLWQFHRPDPKVPYADSVGVFAEAFHAGKVRYVGISNASPEQIDIATSLVPVVSVQNQYSPTHRQPEKDGALARCKDLGLAFLPWSPLGGMGGAKGIGAEGTVLSQIVAELGVSPQQVVLAWHLAQYDRSLPIPGASRYESIADSAKAADLTLSAEQLDRLTKSFA
jgi:aryl-alcohol dehydrogenase-like predicted oxidoreductase